jgi:hypothetical protein
VRGGAAEPHDRHDRLTAWELFPFDRVCAQLADLSSISTETLMKSSTVACFVAMLVAMLPAAAQQPETGPATTRDPPLRGSETGTRGPSGGSPETGYHGPRDVVTDTEPGKQKSAEELRKTGRAPEPPPTGRN